MERVKTGLLLSFLFLVVTVVASACDTKYIDPNIPNMNNGTGVNGNTNNNRTTKFPTDFPYFEAPTWEANLAFDAASWARNWKDDSQRTNGKNLYRFENGSMRFWTEKGSRQRPKLTHRSRNFTFGYYHWRVYIPQMGRNERVSLGAFLYHDDSHELDFEIGSGKAAKRKEHKALDDELLMYLTSQDHPSHQFIHPIKVEKWYDLSMKLTETNDKKYYLEWFVNGNLVDAVKLHYGKEIPFGIHCSLENIDFIGDTYTTREHYALFEGVGFAPPSSASTVSVQSQNPEVKVYPNPVSNMVYVDTGTDEPVTIAIYNIYGTLLHTTHNKRIDMSCFPKGIYTIIVNGKKVKTIKL